MAQRKTLRDIRRGRDLTQAQLVALMNGTVTASAISYIERGERVPSKMMRQAIADALGLKVSAIKFPAQVSQ